MSLYPEVGAVRRPYLAALPPLPQTPPTYILRQNTSKCSGVCSIEADLCRSFALLPPPFQLLDTLVKNCGYPFQLQIATKEFLNELVRKFPERPPVFPGVVMTKTLEVRPFLSQPPSCSVALYRPRLLDVEPELTNDIRLLLLLLDDATAHPRVESNDLRSLQVEGGSRPRSRHAQAAELQGYLPPLCARFPALLVFCAGSGLVGGSRGDLFDGSAGCTSSGGHGRNLTLMFARRSLTRNPPYLLLLDQATVSESSGVLLLFKRPKPRLAPLLWIARCCAEAILKR